jgi:putative tryptophan/tyrosine transport system substrate-binding protein
MRRRDFIALAGGAVAGWPLAARAQQLGRMRRIGVLLYGSENDPEAKGQFAAFTLGLSQAGWTDGRNVRMDVRWGTGDLERMRVFAKELVDLQPDVIFSAATPATSAVQRETRTVPIVFVLVVDPVERGFAESVPRPGGNITGLLPFEPSLGGKWLELLTEIAPYIKRAGIMFNPNTAPYAKSYFLPPLEQASRSLNVEPTLALVHSEAEIETAIASLGREPRGGLVVIPDSFMIVHRGAIMSLAARNNVPAVYFEPYFSRDGGLLSYGPNFKDLFRRAATYVDRVLRGAKPNDLPIELPTKFELLINVKTARALGLAVPPLLLARADEVIE